MSQDSGSPQRQAGRRRSDRIVGGSSATEQTLDQASVAARSEQPVVVVGPSGGGRAHIARAIHAWSRRASEPLEVFSAASTPGLGHARELFGSAENGEVLAGGGHEGAVARAAGGTLVILELDQLSASVRGTLVQAVKNGSFAREDGGPSIAVDVRLIATIQNEDASPLDELEALTVHVAPLSDRSEDVLPLAAHFLALFSEEEGVPAVGFTPDARQALVDEEWTGNVRELRERVHQALRLAGDGTISVEALLLASDGEEVPSFKEAKRSFETRYVKGLLRRCGGNISRAARLAKKDRKDFYDVIRRTGVDPQEFRP